ncbi:MAG: hypothetical protein KF688_07950 [Pirellulales bacterium]|nr:hypothetical protein [Pirellulales bacterium]
MPCVLFTFHAYGTWLPDRLQGYVHWREGFQPQNKRLATAYRRNMKQEAAVFDRELQRTLIDAVLVAAPLLAARIHAIACQSTHLHVLTSWRDERPARQVGAAVKGNLTRRLRELGLLRPWFSKGASRKPVRDRTHFDRLTQSYLPQHGGWKWDEERGLSL